MQRARADVSLIFGAIRSNGGIAKYTYPIGIKQIGSEVPGEFLYSYQNYPNPFNPETKINSISVKRET